MKYREALKQKSKKLTLVTFMGEEEGVKIKSVFNIQGGKVFSQKSSTRVGHLTEPKSED